MKSAYSKSPQCFKGKKVKKRTNKQTNKRMGRKDGAKKKKTQAWPDLIVQDIGKKPYKA